MIQPLFVKWYAQVNEMNICRIIFIHTFRTYHYPNSWINAEMIQNQFNTKIAL